MEKQDLMILTDSGMSQPEIAKELKMTPNNVRYWLKKHNLKTLRVINRDKKYKQCPHCKESKPLTEFYRSRKSSSFCKRCITKVNKERVKKHKQIAVDYKGGSCSICGYNKSLAALDFHHIDPSQKDSKWNNFRGKFTKKHKNELDKCILVCSNCHREIHNGIG